jgi:hypothetical protein
MTLAAFPPIRDAGNGGDPAKLFADPPKAFSSVPPSWWEQRAKGGIDNICVINLVPPHPGRDACPTRRGSSPTIGGACFSSANIHGTLIRERPEFNASWLRSAVGERDGAFYATRAGFNCLDRMS